MGSKTRLSSYCTKRANNGVNLVTSRKINTRLARPISMFLCERKALAAKMVKRERKTDNIDFKTSLVFYPVYTEQSYLDCDRLQPRLQTGLPTRRCTRLHRTFIVQYNKACHIVLYCSAIVTSQSTLYLNKNYLDRNPRDKIYRSKSLSTSRSG